MISNSGVVEDTSKVFSTLVVSSVFAVAESALYVTFSRVNVTSFPKALTVPSFNLALSVYSAVSPALIDWLKFFIVTFPSTKSSESTFFTLEVPLNNST